MDNIVTIADNMAVKLAIETTQKLKDLNKNFGSRLSKEKVKLTDNF
jgi:hypothetical protein